MINEVFSVSAKVFPRSTYQVLGKLMEEVGELSQEVMIVDGFIDKPEGKDGVIGEAIDCITCCLDLIYLCYPNITKEEIMTILHMKLGKWLIAKT